MRATVDTVARTADATIRINPRWKVHVGEIVIRGNKTVSERTIRNSLSFHTGDVFRRVDLSTTQRRLYESGLFQRASITPLRSRDSTAATRARDSTLSPQVRDSVRAARGPDTL